jgi:hypothetical protein
MTTDRQFCRFNRGRSTTSGALDDSPMSLKEIPLGGLCISAFLIVQNKSGKVLMGKIDPLAPWDHLGALDPKRIELDRKGWMLPASHLMVHESPQAAVQRIAEEQLEMPGLVISEPKVISEVYPPKYFPGLDKHWDLEFISFSSVNGKNVPIRSRALRQLKMIDPKSTRRSEIARSHEDILSSVGIILLDS